MYGAAIGDIVGSIYEFGNIKTKEFDLFDRDSEFTDDTVCTVAVAYALLNDLDPAKSFRKFYSIYSDISYGHNFRRWLKDPEMAAYNSYGNGSAMRASPCGMFAKSLDEALALSDAVTQVSHNHPEGMKGARATVHAVFLALHGSNQETIRRTISSVYGYDLSRSVDEIRPGYKFHESCQKSVPEALTCALEASSFEDAIRNAVSIGGDSDTIACISGAVAEGLFGIPLSIMRPARRKLSTFLIDTLDALYARHFTIEIENSLDKK